MVLFRSVRHGPFVLALIGAGCRTKSNVADAPDGSAAAEVSPNADRAGPVRDAIDASSRSRDANPKLDGGPDSVVEPACSGPEVSFHTAIIDERCAIVSARAKFLRAALEREGDLHLRQEAKVLPGGRVALRLVNTGAGSLILPLSFSSKLPAFTVLAEDEQHDVYELEAPRFEVGGAGPSSPVPPDAAAASERPHFARIVLAPNGAAVATITPTPLVARVLRRSDAGAANSADGGRAASTPARLAKGHYTLHVGELLTDVEAGAPARVGWDVP